MSPKDRVEQYQATSLPSPTFTLTSLNSLHCPEIKPQELYNEKSCKAAAKGITLFTNSHWKPRANVPSLEHSRAQVPAAGDRRGPGKNVNWGHTFLFLLLQPRAVTCHPAVVLSPSCTLPHTPERERADVECELQGRTKGKKRIRKRVLKKSYHGNFHLEKCSKPFPEQGRAGSNFSGDIFLETMILYLGFNFSINYNQDKKSLCW